jgi:hypothetical protein
MKSEYSIVGEERQYGDVKATAFDYIPRPEMSNYEPPHEMEGVTGSTIQTKARFRMMDNVKCIVTFNPDGGQKRRRYVSLMRRVRQPDPFNDDNDAIWESSCMVRNETAVRIRNGETKRRDRHPIGRRNKPWVMLWDFSTERYLTHEALLEQLAETGSEMFGDPDDSWKKQSIGIRR